MSEHPTDAHFSFTFVFKQALRSLTQSLILLHLEEIEEAKKDWLRLIA